jgi:spermidine synthase
VKAFETLDELLTPEGQRLSFHRRDGDYFVYLDGEELMSSRAPGSERALAELACGGLGGGARLLIGGLGLGFTLRAALDVLPRDARVVVAELFDKVIEWNRAYLGALQRGALDDPRTRIVHADVWELVRDGGPWDAILLDVDNGPEAWCFAPNRRLYDRAGLERIRTALAPGGVVAFWSAQPDPGFLKRLRKGGFEARAHGVRAHRGRGARHVVLVARPTARRVGGAAR